MPELALTRLGSSDLQITRVGIGTAPIGSSPEWSVNWGPQDKGDAVGAIWAAIEAGINWIDTAPFYGWGRAEQIVGDAIRGRRDEVLLFTKCGTMNDGAGGDFMDLSPESIRRDLDASLRRMSVDHVDLLQLHDPDSEVPIEESWGEVMRLIAEGKVRYGGLSNHGVGLIERALAVGPVVAVQHRYNLLDRAIEKELLPYCFEQGIGVISWASLAEGLLASEFAIEMLDAQDFRRSSPNFQEPGYSKVRALVAELAMIATEFGGGEYGASDVALAWLLTRDGLTGAIVGARTEAEARRLALPADWVLPDAARRRVDDALARLTS